MNGLVVTAHTRTKLSLLKLRRVIGIRFRDLIWSYLFWGVGQMASPWCGGTCGQRVPLSCVSENFVDPGDQRPLQPDSTLPRSLRREGLSLTFYPSLALHPSLFHPTPYYLFTSLFPLPVTNCRDIKQNRFVVIVFVFCARGGVFVYTTRSIK